MNAYEQADALGLYLSGGLTNADPAQSLGGAMSAFEWRGMGAVISSTIPAIIIEAISPENGEGAATIAITGASLVYTPPDGLAGGAVSIAEGARAVLTGTDTSKWVRVYRETGGTFSGEMSLTLVYAMNGVVAMTDADDAERQAGSTRYRCIILKAHGTEDVDNLTFWLGSTGQATFAIGTEALVDGEVQTIADDETAPSGVTFSTPETEEAGLVIGTIAAGEAIALWIRREIPAESTVSAKESVEVNYSYSVVLA